MISDMNLSHTHLRQLGMLHSLGIESDSNVSESFKQQLSNMSRGSNTRAQGGVPASLDPNLSNGYTDGVVRSRKNLVLKINFAKFL